MSDSFMLFAIISAATILAEVTLRQKTEILSILVINMSQISIYYFLVDLEESPSSTLISLLYQFEIISYSFIQVSLLADSDVEFQAELKSSIINVN
ncbi:hypothetical protein FGO68_gene10214 [Halteria grandinella]|uniref:Uncharacterized protein n=1 Tax=Halteria grandinella TaxID=5974 RepID=A0A8J8T8L6_HALGN|nr:hypothetical protein FGO68_gene10214 [Halteria grandinella]